MFLIDGYDSLVEFLGSLTSLLVMCRLVMIPNGDGYRLRVAHLVPGLTLGFSRALLLLKVKQLKGAEMQILILDLNPLKFKEN